MSVYVCVCVGGGGEGYESRGRIREGEKKWVRECVGEEDDREKESNYSLKNVKRG